MRFGSPHEALSAFTRVFDALWRNAGRLRPAAGSRIALRSIRATLNEVIE
jgi:hypothetical protein